MPKEIKKRNSFIVQFPHHYKIPTTVAYNVQLPSWTVRVKDKHNEMDVDYSISSDDWIWSSTIFELYDYIDFSTSKTLVNIINNAQNINIEDTITVSILDNMGDVVETWEIYGTICNVYFGKYDWNSDKPITHKIYFKTNSVKII